MSYIAFDLDALNVVPDVARAAGCEQGDIAHGLLKLWAWCFREETDQVSPVHLRGFFGRDVLEALEAFGFIAREGSTIRVRGAERYLRVSEQRRQAGKARAASAGRSAGRLTSGAPAKHQRTTSEPPALTPNTEHRAPSTESKEVAGQAPLLELVAPPKSATDPRHTPLVGRLTAVFEAERRAKYPFQGRDAKAVATMLTTHEPDAIVEAWRRALRHRGFPTVAAIHELAGHLAHFMGAAPPGKGMAEPDAFADVPREGREVLL